MSAYPTSFRSDQYQIETDLYQGPLDLLLDLIEKAELDITVLSLAQVTDQFLEHIAEMEEENPAEVSAFIVIAARLIQIKSSALLPHSPVQIQDLDEDSGESLARQLIMYRRFKQISGWLADLEETGFRSWERISIPDVGIEPPLDLSDLTLSRLAEIAGHLFSKKTELPELRTVMGIPRITIGQRIKFLIQKIKTGEKLSFKSLLKSGSRVEAVVTFLAMLELIKRDAIRIEQSDIFADIEITAGTTLTPEADFVSEFGD
ncbi:MAG: ScpA family protein [Flexilinea sp.]|jgi:segregation and condensation protein A